VIGGAYPSYPEFTLWHGIVDPMRLVLCSKHSQSFVSFVAHSVSINIKPQAPFFPY